jgi:hypothetical protein
MPVAREHQLYVKIAEYLQENYPDVIYRFDIAADLKLTQGQAAKFKRLHPRRGYPDLFIAKPKDGLNMDTGGNPNYYAGLYLELKAEGNSPFKKDGSLKKDQHLEEQMAILEKLRRRGYRADFATGFDEARAIIDDYLGGEE